MAAVAAVCCAGLLFGCQSFDRQPDDAELALATRSITRDVDQLQQIKRKPRPCDEHRDCPDGSRCDRDDDRCAWDCLADSDCDEGNVCNSLGACVGAQKGHVSVNLSDDSAACQLVDPAEKRAVLLALNDESRLCAGGDDDCPCGAYCANDGTCRVDCLSDNPPAELSCGAGLECTPLGRCAESPDDPGPPIELTLRVAPDLISKNTVAASQLVEAQITVEANSLDVLSPDHPANVFVGFAERRDPVPGVLPRVKCAADAPLAESCELDGGWLFDVGSGSLLSQPRTVWIELPQSATEDSWTLETRSEWAASAATTIVRVKPISFPATDPGRYTGTLNVRNDGAGGSDPRIKLSVEAIVTASHVALFEPTRILFPEGHAVFARAAGKVTMLGWLNSDATTGTALRYDVRLTLRPLAYTQATGQLAGIIDLQEQNHGFHHNSFDLVLDRIGDVDAPACSAGCASGHYCNAAIGRCLLGPPPQGAGIVDATSPLASLASNALRSKQMDAWTAPLATVVAANANHLGGSGFTAMERAYCYRNTAQTGPARFDTSTTTAASRDLPCADDQPQGTFGYANRTKEVEVDAQGSDTFNLLDACNTDLNVQPTGPATASNLLGVKQCASLGRFFLGLNAHISNGVAQQPQKYGQRFVIQLVRQWLGANAFTALSSVQNQARNDVLGTGGPPPHDRLGNAVDLMERTWRVLLDPRVRPQFMMGNEFGSETNSTDYRLVGRPVARWDFNTPSVWSTPDAENQFHIGRTWPKPSGALTVDWWWDEREDPPEAPGCISTERTVTLPYSSFSVAGRFAIAGSSTFQIFESSDPGGSRFWIERTLDRDTGIATFDVKSYLEESEPVDAARFVVPDAGDAFYAFVVDGWTYRMYIHSGGATTEYLPIQVFENGPSFGSAQQLVKLGCNAPEPVEDEAMSMVAAEYDEISLWDRPLTAQDVSAMGARYQATGSMGASLPPRPDFAPEDPQAIALPVHLMETASAHLDLLGAYIEAERAIMYGECYLGGASPSRERVLARTGRGLRMIHVMEREAWLSAMYATPATPWYSRYSDARRNMAGKRAKVIEALELTQSCKNPLGITENDLPLYQGNAVGASDRFFASSRYLASQARLEINAAQTNLVSARNAYQQQRQSAFQVAMSETDKNERKRKLKLEYEGVLRRYCGPPSTSVALLDGFLAGTLTAGNCYLKETCQGQSATPLRFVPPSCLRGEIGERIVALQTTAVDSERALANMDRAVDRYDAEMDYCARRQAHHEESEEILDKHHAHMEKLRVQRANKRLFSSWATSIATVAIGVATSNPALVVGGVTGMLQTPGNILDANAAQSEQNAAAAYDEVVQARSNELDLMACYHTADMQKFAFDEANDVIKRAYHDTQNAMATLDNTKTLLAALVDEARSQLAIEEGIDRTPPHHHYWLHDDIDSYDRHMVYARRLSYLALRAFEWESQEDLGLRSQVLSARLPAHLESVIQILEQHNGPMQGELGVIGETPIVLSLRDEILRLENLAGNTHREPGDPPITNEQALQRLLTSEATKIYENGVFVGHGIRFSMRPAAWAQTSCAERTWRVTTALQIGNLGGIELNNPRMVLMQANAFGSQQCRAAERGALHVARVTPFRNLLVGEAPPQFTPSPPNTAMNVDGLKNMSRSALEALPEGAHEGFAGRGLYGEYILLFPSEQFTQAWLGVVRDVLIRFDIVEVTNAPL
jgi:hypothetical protein